MRRLITIFLYSVSFGIPAAFGENDGSAISTESGVTEQSRAVVAFDSELFSKVQPLYPHIRHERGEDGEAYFCEVRRIASVAAEGGKDRLVVTVSWGIAHPQGLDRGAGEFLIYKDANDELPLIRRSLFPVGSIDVVDGCWLQFGQEDILLCLASDSALEHFRNQGTGIFAIGLPRGAAREALSRYREEGLDAFLRLAPVRPHREREVGELPERISRFDLYPSLVEDSCVPGFKYYNSWEATLFARLMPADNAAQPVVLEIGARGLTEGITTDEVELLLWEIRTNEPQDRPAIEQWKRGR